MRNLLPDTSFLALLQFADSRECTPSSDLEELFHTLSKSQGLVTKSFMKDNASYVRMIMNHREEEEHD